MDLYRPVMSVFCQMQLSHNTLCKENTPYLIQLCILQGPAREEWLRRVKTIYEDLMKEQNLDEAVESYRNLKLPERYTAESVQTTISFLLTQEG